MGGATRTVQFCEKKKMFQVAQALASWPLCLQGSAAKVQIGVHLILGLLSVEAQLLSLALPRA